jgi:hypothetical protein
MDLMAFLMISGIASSGIGILGWAFIKGGYDKND